MFAVRDISLRRPDEAATSASTVRVEVMNFRGSALERDEFCLMISAVCSRIRNVIRWFAEDLAVPPQNCTLLVLSGRSSNSYRELLAKTLGGRYVTNEWLL